MAIFNALKVVDVGDLRKSTLYVARAKIQDTTPVCALSKPCSGCMKAIRFYGIKKVVYTLDPIDIDCKMHYSIMEF
jgi:deoxycytidylate deaminase